MLIVQNAIYSINFNFKYQKWIPKEIDSYICKNISIFIAAYRWIFSDEKRPARRFESSNQRRRRRLIMTRVHTRRDSSRLLLPSFSSSDTLLLPLPLLLLLLLGLLSVRGALPCDEDRAKPGDRDISAFPHLLDIGERKYSREWTGSAAFDNEISARSRRGGTRARRKSGGEKRIGIEDFGVEDLGVEDGYDTRAVVTFAPEVADFRARHEKRKFRRRGTDNAGGGKGVEDGAIDGRGNAARKRGASRAKRNFGRRQKSERKRVAIGVGRSVKSVSNCEGHEEELSGERNDSWRSARRGRSDGGVTDDPEARGRNPVHWAEANGSNLSSSSSEEPFTGFEGSQKFPIKVTYKPPAAAQVEKFDRRHFGPPKADIGETTLASYPSTVSPDLPKSPGRDVLHRHRKVDENTEEERRQEAMEENERGDDATDDSWLPGASSGRRSSNIAAGKSFPEEKRVSTASSVSVSPSAGIDAANESRIERGGHEGNGTAAKSSEKINVTILGLFEMTRGSEPRPEGSSELQAARLAVERVNEMNVLSKFRLRLIHNDTKVGISITSHSVDLLSRIKRR